MKAFLWRQVTLLVAAASGLTTAAIIGVSRGMDASGVMRSALGGACIGGGLLLLARFLLLLVSLDPEKPRSITRQKSRSSDYGSPKAGRS